MNIKYRKVDEGIYAVTVDGTFAGRVNRIAPAGPGFHTTWTGYATPVGRNIARYPTRRDAVLALVAAIEYAKAAR